MNAQAGGGRVLEAVLGSRGVLRVGGSEAIKFLQGLVTRDVTPLAAPHASPQYAALLNSKGRVMYDLLLHREHAESTDSALLLDVPQEGLQQLKSNLTKFKLRADVTIDDASAELPVVARWSLGMPSVSDANLPDPPDLPPDPRHLLLGARAPAPAQHSSDDTAPYSGNLIGVGPADEDAYRALRYSLGIPEGPTEIPTGNAVALEYNIDLLQGVTFDKGCYLGQELVARTHYQGLIRKRVLPVQFDSAVEDTELRQQCVGADVFIEGQSKPCGALRGVVGKLGIAHLRLEKAWEALKAKQAFHASVAGQKLSLQPEAPRWWPSELKPSRLPNLFL